MRLNLLIVSILSLTVLSACQTPLQPKPFNPTEANNTQRPDPYSFSRHDLVKVTHLDLDLAVDFDDKKLEGYALLTYQRINGDATELVLDSRDLKIKRIETNIDGSIEPLKWRMGPPVENLGNALIITLPETDNPIKIHYKSMPQASGLQWLTPAQTSGKEQPFLFSQSQTIHARSWIPIQDTPSVRVTYNATIHTQPEVKPVLSADNNDQKPSNGVYNFSMQQPIPAYLIAIAVGDLEMQQISEHVAIYAEKEVIKAAAYEFATTEDMITATEDLYGKYQWGQYDLLILPPSFPFGGMENPKLSHITPTIIAGDRSLDSLIAHELAHSWSGNLVTNALWKDAWLNEGFTSYIEARITDAVHGKERMVMEAALNYQSLLAAMETLSLDEQKLVNPKTMPHPDDYFSSVTYDKGRFFLEWMEQQVGREAFDEFLNKYFAEFEFNSIETNDFLSFLQQNLLTQNSDKITLAQVDTWLNEPGIPSFFNPPTTSRFTAVDQQVNAWISGNLMTKHIKTDTWTTHEWLHFLRALPETMSNEQLKQLDQVFDFSNRQNSEIAHDWLLISINNEYQPAYARLIDYLNEIGRVKLIKPLYKAMMANPNMHSLALNIYKKARSGYHNIATKQIDEIIGYKVAPAG